MKVESLKYPDIEVDYSPGKPPVIHFYDGEEEVEEACSVGGGGAPPPSESRSG